MQLKSKINEINVRQKEKLTCSSSTNPTAKGFNWWAWLNWIIYCYSFCFLIKNTSKICSERKKEKESCFFNFILLQQIRKFFLKISQIFSYFYLTLHCLLFLFCIFDIFINLILYYVWILILKFKPQHEL